MSRPTISVIIPAYNAARYLPEALDSLLSQTYRASQIIVVDDGSTDDTPGVLHRYRDNVLAIRQENAGDGAARNRAFHEATGTYVAFLDADDVCAPDRFERQVNALERTPEAVACFTGYWRFSGERRLEEFAASDPGDAASLDFLSRCMFHNPSVMFERRRASGVRFPEDVRSSGGDIIFTAILATRGRMIAVPDALYGYRSHPGQKSIGNRANSTSNRFFEYRNEWARTHWREHWPERSWDEIERKLWEGLVSQTEDAYWARYKQFFLNDRKYLQKNWPSDLPRPDVLRWRWYPDWIWRAKGQLDSWIRAKPAGLHSTDARHRLNQEGK